MDNIGYLFSVFSIVWIVVFVYVLFLNNRQKRLQKEIKALKQLLADKGKDR